MNKATEQQACKFAGVFVEHHKLLVEASHEQVQWAIQNGKEAVGLLIDALNNRGVNSVSEKVPASKPSSPILHLISGDNPLVIPACTGQCTIAKAKQTFPGYLDPDFKNWKTDQPSKATPAMPVAVHEMIKDATFFQMFGSLAPSLGIETIRGLILTQDQILTFVEIYPDCLRSDGYATLFLFEENDELFVASVHSRAGREVGVFRFEFTYVWRGEHRRRLVTPQLLVA